MPAIPLQADQFLTGGLPSCADHGTGSPVGRASPFELPLAHLLTGNAAEGKAFFDGAGRCAECHSVGKDLAGIATRYAPVELQARFIYPANVPQTATVRVDADTTVKGAVVYQDAFTISIRDSEGWTRSWPRDSVKVEMEDRLAGHRELLDRLTESDMHNVFAYLETLK